MTNDEFRELLTAAFTAAREAGKRDWHRMTVAVLKNRLLQMTNRQFDEANFGASTFIELVARYHDLVTIDRTSKPPMVEWREHSIDGAKPLPQEQRVRADLWKAVLDYSSGREYEWDAAAGQAKPVDHADPARKLPTVDADVMAAWRAEFASAHRGDLKDGADEQRLDNWAGAGLGTAHLPHALQGPWNAFLKDHVAERLNTWFGAREFVAPSVFVALDNDAARTPPPDFRSFIHRCVDAMTLEELRSLALPAHVLFRVSRSE